MKNSRDLSELQWIAVACAIAAIPLEISKLFLPAFGSANLVDGRVASSLDLTRLALLGALIAVGATRRGRITLQPRSTLGGFIFAFTAFAIASVVWSSAPSASKSEAIRLTFLVLGYGALTSVASDPRVVRRYLAVVEWSMLVMAAAAVAQRVLGVYLWNHPLAPTGRVNVTYADPNILARHLTVGVVLVAATWEPTRGDGRGPSAARRYVLGIGILFSGLLATGSRSSLVASVLALGYVAVRGRRYGSRWPRQALALVVVLGAAVFAADSGIRERFATLLSSNPSLGPRPYLLRAGWNMFLDHPLSGVGLGSFPVVYRSDYREFFSYYGASGVASHTSAVTVLAELGVIGVVLLGAVVVAALTRPAGLERRPDLGRARTGLEAALLALLVASQSEGRLIEDPMFWVVLAGITAIDRVSRSADHVAPQRTRPLGVETAPELVGHLGRVEPPVGGSRSVE